MIAKVKQSTDQSKETVEKKTDTVKKRVNDIIKAKKKYQGWKLNKAVSKIKLKAALDIKKVDSDLAKKINQINSSD